MVMKTRQVYKVWKISAIKLGTKVHFTHTHTHKLNKSDRLYVEQKNIT